MHSLEEIKKLDSFQEQDTNKFKKFHKAKEGLESLMSKNWVRPRDGSPSWG